MGHSQSKNYIAWGPTEELAIEVLKNKLKLDFPNAFIYDDHCILKATTGRTIKNITRCGRGLYPSCRLKVKFKKTD